MATYDFRILLESVEGKKLSFVSQSFVDTSVNLVLSSSQVYNRITGSVSCSYQNSATLSGSDFNKNFTFKDNTLLSASLSGSNQFGFIKFTALNTEYDRLKRYKFIGEKVCTTLGLPNEQWIYVDQARFPVDDELNYFEGNVNANTIYISDNISFSPTSNVLSHITYNIDTGSDKFIRFIDERPHGTDGTQKVGLRMGYDVDVDKYEIGSDITSDFAGHTRRGFSLLGVHEISSSLPNVTGTTNKIKIGTANLQIQGKGGVNLDFVNKDNDASVSGGIYARFSQNDAGALEIRNRIEDQDINIRTEDFNRAIYIKDSTERVGIGDNTPASKLQIAGDLTVDSNVTASLNISASGHLHAKHLILSGGSGVFTSASLAAGSSGGGSADNLGNHTATQDLNLNGNDIFGIQHITASGNISASGDIFAQDLTLRDTGTGDNHPILLLRNDTANPAAAASIKFTSGSLDAVNPRSAALTFVPTTGNLGLTNNVDGKIRLEVSGSSVVSVAREKVTIGTTNESSALLTVQGDISSSGDVIANRYIVNSTVSNITQSFSSGSTIFGDTPADDTHQFTGSVSVTGSFTANTVDINGGTLDGITSLTVANNIDIGSHGFRCLQLQDDSLTSGRVIFAGTSGILSDSSGLTFESNKLAIGGTGASLSIIPGGAVGGHITASGNISASGDIHRLGGILQVNNLTKINNAGDPYIIATGNHDVKIGDTDNGTNSTRLIVDDSNQKVTISKPLSINTETLATNMELTVAGDISASGDLFLKADGDINFGTDNAQIKSSTSALDLIHSQTSFEGGIRLDTRGTIFFANVTDGDLDFATDTKMVISESTGNVGIGTISPGEKLEVVGNISASGEVSANTIVVGSTITHIGDSNTKITFSDDDINLTAAGKTAIDITYDGDGGGDTREITFNEGHADIDVRIEGDTDANLFFTNAGTDRVGVGTNSPGSKLEVDGDFTATHITASGNISASGGVSGSGVHVTGTVHANNVFAATGTSNFTAMNIGGGFGATGVTISSNGNFQLDGFINVDNDITASGNISGSGLLIASQSGIGLTNPETVFHIQQPAGTTPELRVEGLGNTNSKLMLKNSQGNWEIFREFTSKNLVFKNNAGDIPLILNKSNITASGNISASGTITAEQLTTSDDLFVTSDITIGDAIVFGSSQDHDIGITTPGGNSDGKNLNISASDANRESAGNQDGGDVRISGGNKFGSGADGNVILAQIGNVGIGTTSPGEKLEVIGNISASGVGDFGSLDVNGDVDIDGGDLTIGTGLQFTNAGTFNFGFSLGSGKLTFSTDGASLLGQTGKKLRLGSMNTQGVLTISSSHENTMVISGSNVGIGTSNPDSALHIVYSNNTGENTIANDFNPVGIQVENTHADGAAVIRLRSSDADGYILYDDSGANAGDFFFKTDGQDNASVLTLKDGGNVGIGTESPISKLQVDGDLTLTHITASGNISASATSTGSFGRVEVTTADINGGTIDGITSLTVANNIDIGSHGFRCLQLQDDSLTSGRVIFAGTSGILSDSSGLTFANNKLSIAGTGASLSIIPGGAAGGHITASGDISASGTIESTGNIRTDGTLIVDTLRKVSDGSGTGYLRATGNNDVVLGDVGGDANSTKLTVAGGNGTLKFEHDSNDLFIVGDGGHITASGNISASGTITMLTASIGGGIFTSASLAAGGSTSPAGSNTQVQFNDGGSFGGNANFLFNASSQVLTAPTVTVTGDLNVAQDIIHVLDTNTKIRFTTDDIAFQAGGGSVSNIQPGGFFTQGHITASGDISASGGISSSRLYVQDTLQATANKHYSMVINGNDNGTTGESSILFMSAKKGTTRGTFIAAERQNSGNAHDLIFATSDNAAEPVEAMRISEEGRLGIGTTNPGEQLEVIGNISASGVYLGNQFNMTYHNFDASSQTNEFYIPINSTSDNAGVGYQRQWIAPFDGSLEKIRLYAESAGGNTVCKLYIDRDFNAGESANSTSDTVSVSATSTATFTFSSGNTYSAGDLIRVSVDPTNRVDEVNLTCIWKYHTNTL